MKSLKINTGINGNPIIPGDKSISHRSVIIPSISNGVTEVTNILKSEDVIHTINAFKSMGVKIEDSGNNIVIHGNGLNSLVMPKKELYLGNSGTSARLLIGLLSSQSFDSKITGDKSLSSRPMKRISDPLSKMNASIKTTNGCLPVFIKGKELVSSNIDIKIPSAQIKSGIIFAAINTEGITKIIEHNITRDHTEIMLEAFNAGISVKKVDEKSIIEITGKKELVSKNIDVPSDLSSSAFFIVAALIHKNSNIILRNINMNPTRNGLMIALMKMGAKINFFNTRTKNNEAVSDIEIVDSNLNGCELGPEIAKLMIDEYPILSVAASFANSPSIFRGLSELRVKESDRLELIRLNLTNCGIDCKVIDDDLYINPLNKKKVGNVDIVTNYDHRIAMAFSILGSKLCAVNINDSNSIKTSFPTFVDEFNKVGGKIVWKRQ